ncbi:hypothetical protein GOV10_00780 [Candidatus Woesearchaeota archaeon]|nr:hypothetical protein [Candidatus Woesearchaeota archaeon]
MKVLNSKERKRIHQQLNEQYGFEGKLGDALLLNENKGRLYVVNQEVMDFDSEGMRIESIGLYVGTKMNDGLRLTIEGSQIVGPSATKNVFELSDEQHHGWLRGRDLDLPEDFVLEGWLILKHKNEATGVFDFLGSGKVVKKEQEGGSFRIVLHNYIPKTRYVRSED